MLRIALKAVIRELEDPHLHKKQKAKKEIWKNSIEQCLGMCEVVVLGFQEWKAFGAQV